MDKLVNQVVTALREKPMRFAWVCAALVVGVVLFTLAEFLPAPYEMRP
jgi:hypothetical protein